MVEISRKMKWVFASASSKRCEDRPFSSKSSTISLGNWHLSSRQWDSRLRMPSRSVSSRRWMWISTPPEFPRQIIALVRPTLPLERKRPHQWSRICHLWSKKIRLISDLSLTTSWRKTLRMVASTLLLILSRSKSNETPSHDEWTTWTQL